MCGTSVPPLLHANDTSALYSVARRLHPCQIAATRLGDAVGQGPGGIGRGGGGEGQGRSGRWGGGGRVGGGR